MYRRVPDIFLQKAYAKGLILEFINANRTKECLPQILDVAHMRQEKWRKYPTRLRLGR